MTFVSKVIFRSKLINGGLLPKEGYIIAMNHNSYFDHFHIIVHEKRVVRFLANEKLFSNPFLNWFFTNMQQIRIDRNKGKNKAAIKKTVKVLKKGGVIGIYPEGTIKGLGATKLLRGHTGVARIAILANAPIVPACIIGNKDVFGRLKRIPRPMQQKLIIGKPIYLDDCEGKENDRLVLRKITDDLMLRIQTMIDAEEKRITPSRK